MVEITSALNNIEKLEIAEDIVIFNENFKK